MNYFNNFEFTEQDIIIGSDTEAQTIQHAKNLKYLAIFLHVSFLLVSRIEIATFLTMICVL